MLTCFHFLTLSNFIQRGLDTIVNRNTFVSQLLWDARLAAADAHQRSLGPVCRHLLEGVTNDGRRIVADAQLQENNFIPFVLFQKFLIPAALGIPLRILNEIHILADVDLHAFPAAGAVRHQIRGNTAIPLLFTHLHHEVVVVIERIVATAGTLQFSVVSLHRPDAQRVKARFIKLCVHVGGDNEVGKSDFYYGMIL